MKTFVLFAVLLLVAACKREEAPSAPASTEDPAPARPAPAPVVEAPAPMPTAPAPSVVAPAASGDASVMPGADAAVR